MSKIKAFDALSDVSVIEYMTPAEMEEKLREAYTEAYTAAAGEKPTLAAADRATLELKAMVLMWNQLAQYIQAKYRAEMLPTSQGPALDALAAHQGVTRLEATRAVTTVRFSLSEPQPQVVPVAAGTRVRTKAGIYFHTTEYGQFLPGQTTVDLVAKAEQPGIAANNLAPGVVDTLVDVVAYVASVQNIDTSSGGTDAESDEALTERVFLAPSAYSVAGPLDAYRYMVRKWRSDVKDVEVVRLAPCVLGVYVVLEDGSLLSTLEKNQLEEWLNGETVRPLTDTVTAKDPEEIPYSVDAQYWISASDKNKVAEIQKAAQQAMEEYTQWQRKLGRDVDPGELLVRLRAVGVKRVKITAPEDMAIKSNQLPRLETQQLLFGGVEDA